MVKDRFPNYYKITNQKAEDFWGQENQLEVFELCEILFDYYETDLEKTADNLDLKLRVSTAIVTDLIELKHSEPEHAVTWDFLQFLCATTISDFVTNNTLFSLSFDWICNSLSDEISVIKKRETKPDRIATFGSRKEAIYSKYFLPFFFIWIKTLFYYSRCTGGHNELCEFVLNFYFKPFIFFSKQVQSLDACLALGQVAAWCFNHKKIEERRSCDKVLGEFAINAKDINVRMLAAFHLSTIKSNHTDKTRYEWAMIVEEKYSKMLSLQQRLQLQLNLYGSDTIRLRQNFETLVETARQYSEHYSTKFSIIDIYHRNRIFTLFEEPILTLLYSGELELLRLLLGAYFLVSECDLKESDILYIIPNTPNGVAYICQDTYLVSDTNSYVNIPKIVDAGNQFLGHRHTLIDELSFSFGMPERPGVPNSNFATQYLTTLKQHFKFEKLLFYPQIGNCSGMYLQNGTQMPIQSIIALEIGKTIPWVYSFQQPLQLAPLQKVFVWEGYTQFAEIERIGLEETFSSLGISFNFINSNNATKDDFLREYGQQYDVFWILGHGEIFSDQMHLSYLDLGNGIHITLEDLSALDYKSDKRRLLVIDTCDSATTGLQNNPLALGLGLSVVNKCQSVVGHSWPVENIASLVSGLLLASFLGSSFSYEESVTSTILLFYKGKEAVLNHLRRYVQNPDVLDRIENTFMDFQNFYYWGSLNYFI